MAKISVDRSTIIYLYRKYRDYLVPILTIIVSFILFLEITIPTLNNLSTREQEVKFEKQKLATLKNNLNILSKLNESTLTSNLSITSSVLPSGKNFAEVLNAVSVSANKSGVFLGDYEFQVGDLSKINIPSKGLPTLSLSLTLNGNPDSTARFANQLYKSSPIAEVLSIEVNGSRATLSTVFYYKPFSQAKVDEYLPLTELSKKDLDLLSELSTWNSQQTIEGIIPILSPTPSSSSSAF